MCLHMSIATPHLHGHGTVFTFRFFVVLALCSMWNDLLHLFADLNYYSVHSSAGLVSSLVRLRSLELTVEHSSF